MLYILEMGRSHEGWKQIGHHNFIFPHILEFGRDAKSKSTQVLTHFIDKT